MTVMMTGEPLFAGDAADDWESPGFKRLVDEQQFVEIIQDADGNPIIKIDYPWYLNKHVSIEVRDLIENDRKDFEIKPLRFKYEVMWEETKEKIHKMRENADPIRDEAKFLGEVEGRQLSFRMYGDCNTLDKRSVVIGCVHQLSDDGGEGVIRRAIFPFAEDWSADKRTLYLDLPPEIFTEPGKIRLWFLRGKDTLWSRDIEWPGYGSAEDDAQN